MCQVPASQKPLSSYLLFIRNFYENIFIRKSLPKYDVSLFQGIHNKWQMIQLLTLHKKWSFPFKICSVNVTESAVSSYGFHHKLVDFAMLLYLLFSKRYKFWASLVKDFTIYTLYEYLYHPYSRPSKTLL